MTKPRTHKIHRKSRGSRRGFKSRSQRGGFNWKFWEPDLSNQNGTESKKGWFDGWFGNSNNQNDTYNPRISTPISAPVSAPVSTPVTAPVPGQQRSFVYGGRRKCGKHHKHSRQCKK